MAFHRLDPQSAAEKAVSVIGFGYDLTNDVRLSACKPGPSGSRLIELDPNLTRNLVVPGGCCYTCFHCNQMSEKLNQDLSLSGKIPSGLFNAMFDFRGCWQKDAASVKSLAYDGWFITLYNIELERSHLTLSEQLKQEVPTSWDAAALAVFIEKYGTHIVVGVDMGGKDVIHIKQLQKSNVEPPEVQKLLTQLADERFSEEENAAIRSRKSKQDGHSVSWDLHGFATSVRLPVINSLKNEDILSIAIRRGGVDIDKPPIEELHQFLEFQLPRQWAPVYGDLPLTLKRRKQASPSLRFTFMGPKLYVNTMQASDWNALYLEGKRSDHLAIHLQHLSTLPDIVQLSDDHRYEPVEEPVERGYFEPVNWSIFSHVCTAPVQYNGAHIDDSASIVTKAWFEVKMIGMKKVLFLRLGFSMVASARIRRSEWDGPSTLSRKSGVFSMLISTRFSAGLNPPPEKPVKVDVNSAVFPGGPPSLTKAPKMSNFVDTKEMVRGPEDPPGYWVVTGAKLCVDGGRISIKVKYSLLAIMSEESMMLM
ncbi:hypothetical protein GH714_002575 [Hevea brasiliensis]|uniref:MACPF domain-containing protein n=1 Tax=Hevea brasiliensis TaxID=3981 RepID=A0A6A6L9U1_HEVBR|nr:hypothetical protein GH714_002575 [Hevea brasiliensis]